LDDAINQLILSRPDANVVTTDLTLVAGTRQSLPDNSFSLIDIYMNKGSDGSNGLPIYQVERQHLDYFSSWQTAVPQSIITEFAYDLRTPKTFWVSPPSDGTSIIEMDYSAMLNEFAKMSDDFDTILDMTIDLKDVFKGPIVNYMLYLLYSTDSSSGEDRAIAQRYEQAFYQSLSIEYKASIVHTPTNVETISGLSTTQAPAGA
jgi:hypothetical protein